MVEPGEETGAHTGRAQDDERAAVWILVDRSAREAAFDAVAEELRARGMSAQIVTISEVISSVARDALAGGAERLLRGLRVAFKGRGAEEDFLGAVRRARPDVLAVTNPRYGRALSLLESLAGISTLQVGILPDFNLSTDWINSSLQAFIVPTEEHRQRLAANGLLAERVLVARPAIQHGFSVEVDREQVREGLGFADKTVILVRANPFSPSTVEKLVFQATMVEKPVQFIFHHDGDGACAAALRRAADQYRLGAAMFGRVDDLERFVAASDLVLAAPDEPYVAEILAQGRPILFVGAEQGAAAQAEFLADAGAAHYVADVLRLGGEIRRTIHPDKLQQLAQAANALGARDGSRQVADALSVALEHADAWLRAPASHTGTPEAGGSGDGGAADVPVSGPFETIGTGRSVTRDTQAPASPDDARTPRRAPAEPAYSGLSAAEAKDQLAELILREREFERRMGEVQKQQQRWQDRLQLAREWNEADLANEAADILRGFNAEADALQRDLDDVRRQKDKLKRAVRQDNGGTKPRALLVDQSAPGRADAEDVEARFRRMELDRDLDSLKDKIDRDFGD